MIIKRAFRIGVSTVAVLAATVGCEETAGPAGTGAPPAATRAAAPSTAAPAPSSATGAGPAPGTGAAPAPLKPSAGPREVAQRFAQALSRRDAERACGLADARLRSFASSRAGSCAAALAELATDTRYVFTQTACVDAPASYEAGGDPQDGPDSLRVSVDCPEGYTWLRVERLGTVWRVTEFNAP
ncbi:hypothetical protein [Streptomyces sp. NPDC101132]|uniref:hypothetical protein n=1 Tax=Streptomyces sp. NPDC101132 TaxID=3366110 RepID=UPI003807EFC6